MADGALGTDRTKHVKSRTSARLLLRFFGRFTAVALALLVSTLVGVQFARVLGENVAMAHELSAVRSDITTLEKRRDVQRQELLRLEDPEGTVPEIHDRLRLMRPNEAMIFISTPKPSPTP